MKMNLRLYIIATVAVVALGLWLLTGGLALQREITFTTESVNVLCSVSSIEAYGWVKTEINEFKIPFIFHYTRFTKPFHIRLTITDHDSSSSVVEILNVIIEYASGATSEFDLKWQRQFQTNSYSRAMDEGLVRIHKWQADDRLDNMEIYPHDATITLDGILTTRSGETFPLRISFKVKVNKAWRIMTIWEEYASC